MANVKVALRVRPLTVDEIAENQILTAIPDGNAIRLKNPRVSGDEQDQTDRGFAKRFEFDYCYWSVDCSDFQYTSQESVFRDLGKQVLDALFDGYNACVFAYGQSGTGKTYTMIGTESDPGITPRLCSAIFERISNAVHRDQVSFQIDISFLEIYNEKVRDLLQTSEVTSNGRSSQLRIREHPKLGPYVQGLSRHLVQDASSALALLYRGMQRRVSATTNSNGHSSRSHAVFTVSCTAAQINGNFPRETTAKLHLVDLAGSERANRDASRLRLKEGATINKSLTTLGNVINALVERASFIGSRNLSSCGSNHSLSSSTSFNNPPPASSQRVRLPFIPYRNSVLTWLLKDSLGGNSRTFMVAAISPSSGCYKETLSTLRFAQRAKFIVNKPVVNEEAGVKLIRHLKEEVTRLRSILETIHAVDLSNNDHLMKIETIAKLMAINETKARQLTKDWLHKWRSKGCEDTELPAERVHLMEVRFNDVGVQTLPWSLNEREEGPLPTIALNQVDSTHAKPNLESSAQLSRRSSLVEDDSSTCYVSVTKNPNELSITEGFHNFGSQRHELTMHCGNEITTIASHSKTSVLAVTSEQQWSDDSLEVGSSIPSARPNGSKPQEHRQGRCHRHLIEQDSEIDLHSPVWNGSSWPMNSKHHGVQIRQDCLSYGQANHSGTFVPIERPISPLYQISANDIDNYYDDRKCRTRNNDDFDWDSTGKELFVDEIHLVKDCGRPPTPPRKPKRIHARKTVKPKPHIRTIFRTDSSNFSLDLLLENNSFVKPSNVEILARKSEGEDNIGRTTYKSLNDLCPDPLSGKTTSSVEEQLLHKNLSTLPCKVNMDASQLNNSIPSPQLYFHNKDTEGGLQYFCDYRPKEKGDALINKLTALVDKLSIAGKTLNSFPATSAANHPTDKKFPAECSSAITTKNYQQTPQISYAISESVSSNTKDSSKFGKFVCHSDLYNSSKHQQSCNRHGCHCCCFMNDPLNNVLHVGRQYCTSSKCPCPSCLRSCKSIHSTLYTASDCCSSHLNASLVTVHCGVHGDHCHHCVIPNYCCREQRGCATYDCYCRNRNHQWKRYSQRRTIFDRHNNPWEFRKKLLEIRRRIVTETASDTILRHLNLPCKGNWNFNPPESEI